MQAGASTTNYTADVTYQPPPTRAHLSVTAAKTATTNRLMENDKISRVIPVALPQGFTLLLLPYPVL